MLDIPRASLDVIFRSVLRFSMFLPDEGHDEAKDNSDDSQDAYTDRCPHHHLLHSAQSYEYFGVFLIRMDVGGVRACKVCVDGCGIVFSLYHREIAGVRAYKVCRGGCGIVLLHR